MKIYKTQEEYDNELCYIPSDTLSIVIENNKVNYGVNVHEGSGYFVKLDGEKIDIGNNIIPLNYNCGNTDISFVEIGCGIDAIYDNAFANCTNLSNVTILGNISTICFNAFSRCENLHVFKYYGTEEPIYKLGTFKTTLLDVVQVTKDYEGERFCDLNIDRCL